MAKPGERRSKADEDLKRIVKVGPAGALSTVMILLAVIAILVLGITLLFRQ